MSPRRVGQILGFNESQIRKWDTERKKILDAPTGKRKLGSTGRRPQWPELEERLAIYSLEGARRGWFGVSWRWFERHAIEIFDEEIPNEVAMVDGECVRSFALVFSRTPATSSNLRLTALIDCRMDGFTDSESAS
jgi:hypothetical protein